MRRNLLILLLSVTLSLGLAEFALGVNEKLENTKHAVPPEIGQFDPHLGWTLKPNTKTLSKRYAHPVEYRINSLGMRDEETTLEKPDGVFRIVLLGDSNTFGYGVPIEKHFSRLLEGYFKNFEVINLGVSGYGIDQMLLRLQSEGFKFEPDLVMLFLPHYANQRHMHSQRFHKNKPRFILDNQRLVLTYSPVQDPRNHSKSLLGSLADRSRLLSRVRSAYWNLQEAHAGQTQSKNQAATTEDNSPAFMKQVHALGDAILLKLHEESIRNNAQFVLVTRLADVHTRMRGHGIASLEVNEALDNTAFPLPDGKHMNEASNGVLTWEIAKFLKTENLVTATHFKHPPQSVQYAEETNPSRRSQ